MKAIIFDMGGVLIDLDMDACRNAFKQDLDFYEIDEILDPCHQKGIIGDMEEGKVSADDFRKYVLDRSRPGARPEEVDKALYKILAHIAPYKIELLRSLSEKYDIYMLSNNNPIAEKRASEMFREAGFSMETDFKECFMSYKMKMLKPSVAFYKEVMRQIGLPASEMLFIDDSQSNVDAAVAAGLPAVWYKPGEDLKELVCSQL